MKSPIRTSLMFAFLIHGMAMAADTDKVTFQLEIVDNLADRIDLRIPLSATFDANGNAYIYDFKTKQIIQLDKDGNELKRFGGMGQGPGEFTGPAQLDVDGETLYAYDIFERSLTSFNLDGTYKEERKLQTSLERIRVFEGNYYLFYASDAKQSLTIHDSAFKELTSLTLKNRTPYTATVAVDIDEQGNLYCGLFDQYKVEIYNRQGKYQNTIERAYETIGPFHYKSIKQDVMLPVITGLNVTPEYIVTQVGGMQYTYEEITKKSLDETAYLTHLDIYDRKGHYLGKVWNETLPNKTYIYGQTLFAIAPDGTIWLAPSLDGDLYRCRLTKTP